MKQKKKLEEILNDSTLTSKDKYHFYINKSDEWKEVRENVLIRDNYTCRCCGRTKDDEVLIVHHRSYKTLFNEQQNNYEDLITLCRICHKAIHSAKSNLQHFTLKNNKN